MRMYAVSTLQLALALAVSWLMSIDLIQAKGVCDRHYRRRFNSDAGITAYQREKAGISLELANDISDALKFERKKWINGPASDEEFYRAPSGTADAPAGTLLKLELDANTSIYTLPPNTALSRFLFQTETLNGTKVPASAFVLWPYLPRTQPDEGGYQVVVWAHGTTGGFAECAPSHVRNLWSDFIGLFTLVLQGYVVVAPDYAGLGVGVDSTDCAVTHEYLANPSHANDVFYSVQAAQSAFPVLSKEFVVVGHSQGGGAAWGAAQRQASNPVEGYLGAVAAAPVTNFLDISDQARFSNPTLIGSVTLILRGISSVFPDFDAESILTPQGIKLITLLPEIQGCNSVLSAFVATTDFLLEGFASNFYVQSYRNLTSNGSRPIAGPMLVVHGDADAVVPFPAIATAIRETCELYPESQLEFAAFANATHTPAIYASQRIWLEWIEDRFAGVEAPDGCHRTDYESARPYMYYEAEENWYIEMAKDYFQII